MARVKILHPDPDLEDEGFGAGAEGEMPEARARALAARGLVAIVAPRSVPTPPAVQAHTRAPETKRAGAKA